MTGRHYDIPVECDGTQMTDAEKLRALAEWFDVFDNQRDYRGPRTVQADLRRIAEEIACRTPRS